MRPLPEISIPVYDTYDNSPLCTRWLWQGGGSDAQEVSLMCGVGAGNSSILVRIREGTDFTDYRLDAADILRAVVARHDAERGAE